MKKKANLLELLVWAALVSFIAMAPAHSQSINNGQTLFGDSTWTANFDMATAVDAAGNPAGAQNSSGDTGDQSHQTYQAIKPVEPARSPKPQLEHADNGNITMGSIYGSTSFPSGQYSFGFNGTGASISPFNTGLPPCSTGSVDFDITE
jgi:hypothetical protein